MKTITLNFIGKSSVPFNRTIEVSDELYEVIKRSQENKKPTDEIFDMVDSGDVGNFLKEVDKSFSPKVLRTAATERNSTRRTLFHRVHLSAAPRLRLPVSLPAQRLQTAAGRQRPVGKHDHRYRADTPHAGQRSRDLRPYLSAHHQSRRQEIRQDREWQYMA